MAGEGDLLATGAPGMVPGGAQGVPTKMKVRGQMRLEHFLAAAALPLAACGTVATGTELEGVRADLTQLRRQVQEVKASGEGNRRSEDMAQRLGTLNTRILALEGQVRALQQAMRSQSPAGAPGMAAP